MAFLSILGYIRSNIKGLSKFDKFCQPVRNEHSLFSNNSKSETLWHCHVKEFGPLIVSIFDFAVFVLYH